MYNISDNDFKFIPQYSYLFKDESFSSQLRFYDNIRWCCFIACVQIDPMYQ